MRAAGTRPAAIRRLWVFVALICTAASVAGYAIADNVSDNLNAGVDGFAAGALLVMLDRLDDPGGGPQGRRHRGSGHRSGLRDRRRPFRSQMSAGYA